MPTLRRKSRIALSEGVLVKSKWLPAMLSVPERGYTDCFGHAQVLRGAVDAMVDPIVSIWDIAPLACLVKEAGGQYFAMNGEETIRAKSFITCGPNLKNEILAWV